MTYMYENAFMKLVFCAPFLVIQIETVYVEKDTLFRPEDGIWLPGARATGIGESSYEGAEMEFSPSEEQWALGCCAASPASSWRSSQVQHQVA